MLHDSQEGQNSLLVKAAPGPDQAVLEDGSFAEPTTIDLGDQNSLDFVSAAPGSEEYERRFLMQNMNFNHEKYLLRNNNRRRALTTTASNATNGTNGTATVTITCPPGTLDWSDSTKWPPNAKIDQVPQCALPSLSQQQLQDLGFFDKVHTTKVVSGNDRVKEAVSAFAASVAEKMPAKKVISYVVQTITAVNLFRDAKDVYLPKDRYKDTVMETYTSPNTLEVHVGVFVLPKRVQIDSLCPNQTIESEQIANTFAYSRSVQAENWKHWTFEPQNNFKATGCKTTPFVVFNATAAAAKARARRKLSEDAEARYAANGELAAEAADEVEAGFADEFESDSTTSFSSTTLDEQDDELEHEHKYGNNARRLQGGQVPPGQHRCASAREMKQYSDGKYRLFCVSDFLPTNSFQYELSGPLTGHWRFPEERDEGGLATTKPEWVVDLETVFSVTFDKKFLDVERGYMSGSTDYVDGQVRLWAAEPLARGKARCTNAVTGCAQGIPANAPMFLPRIRLSVDREKNQGGAGGHRAGVLAGGGRRGEARKTVQIAGKAAHRHGHGTARPHERGGRPDRAPATARDPDQDRVERVAGVFGTQVGRVGHAGPVGELGAGAGHLVRNGGPHHEVEVQRAVDFRDRPLLGALSGDADAVAERVAGVHRGDCGVHGHLRGRPRAVAEVRAALRAD
mmetsp:Transcript_17540/g.43757  ORF Transcript_17540/g.43757 Transcript_17540/m.43757 type:complete len:682 (+) Transcript_17540:8322-10367(+)